MQELSKSKISFAPVVILFIAFVVIFLVWLYWGADLVWWTATYWRNRLANDGPPDPTLTIAELGQIGDLFGGVNSLFASFAFIGVAFAAYYQRKTYLQQRQDSEANQKALAQSNATNALLLSNANHELFIGVFLRMVEQLYKAVENIDSLPVEAHDHNTTKTDEGLQKIETILSDIGLHFDEFKKSDKAANLLAKSDVQSVYFRVFNRNEKRLSPFIRNFYQTFSLIQESGISYKEQERYSQIALASIDDKFLIIMMMYGLTSRGSEMKALIEKYGILEEFPSNPRGAKVVDLAKRFYATTAFQPFFWREFEYDKANAERKRDEKHAARREALQLVKDRILKARKPADANTKQQTQSTE